MEPRRVLLVGSGDLGNIGACFLDALKAVGKECYFVESDYLRDRLSLSHRVASRLIGRRPLTYWRTNREVRAAARHLQPDVVLIIKGAWIAPATLAQVKRLTGACLVNYATDDPFNPAVSTADLVNGIPEYDLYVCTKRRIMDDVRKAKCRKVTYVPFGYEPSLHFPEIPATVGESERFASDVVFVGGADGERVSMMSTLVANSGAHVDLYGGFWNRNAELRAHYRGFALGRDYRLALGGAKIALGLVRRANRDGHSMRSFEIPACGAFMLAERTEEHLEVYQEDKEAAYFDSDGELVDKVRYYLAHDSARRRIARGGYDRVTKGANTYQDRLRQIFSVGLH